MKYIIHLLIYTSICLSADNTIGGLTFFSYENLDDVSAFELNRQYISVKGSTSDDTKYSIVFDIGRMNLVTGPESIDNRLTAFLKKAQIDHNTSLGTISMGLIARNSYGVQEKNWGYRFIQKSALDKNGFIGGTTDLGLGISRKLIDNFNLSLQLTNGGGYKKPQEDKHYKISLNATYGESKLHKNNGFNTGLVYTTESTDSDPITMISVFGGYASSCPIFASNSFRIGSEYDMMTDSEGKNKTLISLSTNYRIMENWNIFLRYDIHDPDVDKEKDGDSYLIAGILLNCGNGLFVAPNVKISTPEEGNATTINMINFQYKF